MNMLANTLPESATIAHDSGIGIDATAFLAVMLVVMGASWGFCFFLGLRETGRFGKAEFIATIATLLMTISTIVSVVVVAHAREANERRVIEQAVRQLGGADVDWKNSDTVSASTRENVRIVDMERERYVVTVAGGEVTATRVSDAAETNSTPQ